MAFGFSGGGVLPRQIAKISTNDPGLHWIVNKDVMELLARNTNLAGYRIGPPAAWNRSCFALQYKTPSIPPVLWTHHHIFRDFQGLTMLWYSVGSWFKRKLEQEPSLPVRFVQWPKMYSHRTSLKVGCNSPISSLP